MSIAAERAVSSGQRVTLVEADAGALPYADATFDTVVATFVLCSVGDVGRSLREARRVLRPDGTIRLLEHARSGHPMVGALQDRIAPMWARVSGGCRLDHDVLGAVRSAELTVIEVRQHACGTLIEIGAACPAQPRRRESVDSASSCVVRGLSERLCRNGSDGTIKLLTGGAG